MTGLPIPSIATCIEAVSKASGVTRQDILSARRGRAVARPRQVVMWVAVRTTARTLSEIGRIMSRDHTTVIHAIRTIDRLRASGDIWVTRLSNEALHKVTADPRQEEMAI